MRIMLVVAAHHNRRFVSAGVPRPTWFWDLRFPFHRSFGRCLSCNCLDHSLCRLLFNNSCGVMWSERCPFRLYLDQKTTQFSIFFVNYSALNLTLWVPFLFTNRSPCRKKSILAKVGLGAKGG